MAKPALLKNTYILS
uniref:GTP cyclohydrolase I n=1 Tax=Rhizophora mucronata TaxID=61149 RepID=A0A2P2N5A0_RHIMU